MSRIRSLLLLMLGMVVLGAILAPMAAAASPDWWVEKALLGEGKSEPLAEETKVTTPFSIELHGAEGTIKFVVECEAVKLKKAAIEGPSMGSYESVVFEKCKAVGKPECTIATTETKPLAEILEGSTGAITLKFKPKSGTEIATYLVTGALCVEKGAYHADGTMICNYSGVETESLEHPLEFTTSSGSKVTVGGLAAAFSGTTKFHLASKKLWSAR